MHSDSKFRELSTGTATEVQVTRVRGRSASTVIWSWLTPQQTMIEGVGRRMGLAITRSEIQNSRKTLTIPPVHAVM